MKEIFISTYLLVVIAMGAINLHAGSVNPIPTYASTGDGPTECTAGTVGTPPNCFPDNTGVAPPVPKECPEAWYGTPPYCVPGVAGPTPKCAEGTVGIPPNCVSEQASEGGIQDFPQKCPDGTIAYDCTPQASEQTCIPGGIVSCETQRGQLCPEGTIGVPPDCQPITCPGDVGIPPECEPSSGASGLAPESAPESQNSATPPAEQEPEVPSAVEDSSTADNGDNADGGESDSPDNTGESGGGTEEG